MLQLDEAGTCLLAEAVQKCEAALTREVAKQLASLKIGSGYILLRLRIDDGIVRTPGVQPVDLLILGKLR